MVPRFRLIDFKLFLTFCSAHRSRHLQLCAWSIEGRRVAESVYAGSRAAGPREKTPRDPPLSGRYCRNETAEVRHAHSNASLNQTLNTHPLKSNTACLFTLQLRWLPPNLKLCHYVHSGSWSAAICSLFLSPILWFISTWTARAANMLLSNPLYATQSIYYL